MENNNRVRVHFNLFDAIIILLVIAVLAGAMLLRSRGANGNAGPAQSLVPMRYTVELTDAPYGMAELMELGSDVYCSTDNAYLGKLVDVEKRPHRETTYSPNREEYVVYETGETDDVYVTIEGNGYASTREIVVGGKTVRVGESLAVKGLGYAHAGYISAVDPMSAALPEDNTTGTGELEAVYTVRYTDMRDFVADAFQVGDHLYDSLTGAHLGVIEKVDVEPYVLTMLGKEGQPVRVEKTERYAAVVTLHGRAVQKPDGYYLDGATELKVGATTISASRRVIRSLQFDALISIGEAR